MYTMPPPCTLIDKAGQLCNDDIVNPEPFVVTEDMWLRLLDRISALENPEGVKAELATVSREVSAAAKGKRGSRLPEGWAPSTDAITRIKGEFPFIAREQFLSELAKFTDYWLSKAGKDAVKIDWDRTWCNWMRNAAERMPRSSTRMSTVDQKVADLQSMKE